MLAALQCGMLHSNAVLLCCITKRLLLVVIPFSVDTAVNARKQKDGAAEVVGHSTLCPHGYMPLDRAMLTSYADWSCHMHDAQTRGRNVT